MSTEALKLLPLTENCCLCNLSPEKHVHYLHQTRNAEEAKEEEAEEEEEEEDDDISNTP